MIKFEKISFEQFKKDILDDRELYDEMRLPMRATAGAAAYDLPLLQDVELAPGEIKKIPTGLKAKYPKNVALLLLVRSRMGFKYNVRMCNQIGLIDADYYNNPGNEGHMWIRVQNEGTETVVVKRGDAIAQAMFINYLTTTDDIAGDKKRSSDK